MKIVADIGGTNARIAIFKNNRLFKIRTYKSREFSCLEDLILSYINDIGETKEDVSTISIAIAGTISEEGVKCVNLDWEIKKDALLSCFSGCSIKFLNDFEAVAGAVPYLKALYNNNHNSHKHLYPLICSDFLANNNSDIGAINGAIAVVGAGTGLGEAILCPCSHGDNFHIIPTEGGHSDFAPETEVDWGLFLYLRERYGHVSIERVVSGQGIRDIYEFIANAPAPSSEEIVNKAILQEDIYAEKTLSIFTRHYAREASNLALKSLSYNGVYLAGGIAPKIGEKFLKFGFKEAFLNKGRMKKALMNIPVFIIMHPYPGLLGAGLLMK